MNANPWGRAPQEWGLRARAEYRSAAISAQLLHWLIQAGLPLELLETGRRIVGDELVHAQLCAEVVEALGSDWQPAPTETADLALPASPDGLLASILESLLPNFLLGETLAVPLFGAMRRDAQHPQVLAALTRILADEAVHRAFGWQVLDALLELDPDGVRAWLSARLPPELARLRALYAGVQGPPLTKEERGCGLLEPSDWTVITDRAIEHDVLPRLRQRGIAQGLHPHP
ncbi:MAG: ferritin-like domain-containing protein [Myxococcota bacterium]|nr:ferritin-like domain-containing protein [Myxococcota bacterium]